MAVSSTTDYLDDSFLTELFDDPLISQLIDRSSPSATTSSHLPSNGANTMNRRHWSQDDSGGQFRSSSSTEAPSSTTSTTDLKHLLNAEVVLKTDVFNGKRGTINTISYDGLATVTIDGGVQIRLPYCALQLIPPQPGDKVIVTSGSLKGLPGTLLSAEGSDGIIMSQVDHKIWVVKLHTLAKMSSSGYLHHHHQHHQQMRPSSTSTMYSHQALSPTSPLTPTTPTSTSVRPSTMYLGAGSPVTPTTPSSTSVRPSTMYLGTGSPVTPTTPTPMRNSPMYSSSVTTLANGGIAPPNPMSPHTPSPSHCSSASRHTHRGHVTTATVAGPHSMFSGTDGLKPLCEEGPSTKEWIEYLLRRPSVKRETSKDDDDKDDIKASVVQISLVCPVSQRRMEYPCRGIHCKHLQCFDAEAYINMNKSWRPKMKLKTVNGSYHSSLAIKADSRLKCPVCNKHTPFDALYLDKELMEMIRTTAVSDVEWSGGGWRTIQKAPQDSGADVIDLTLSDSDNE
ncbi:hypothetical protein EMCRGX_G021500 [Ephydatia muelleri]